MREHGIPIITFPGVDSEGRKIAAYKFGKFKKKDLKKYSGRTLLSKKIKKELTTRYGSKCFIYKELVDSKDLQIDHRVPYEIGGDSEDGASVDNFMLLSPSANRAKSWSCEHCKNWTDKKNVSVCLSCYWASPEKYSHVACKQIRRVDLLWEGKEVGVYDKLKRKSKDKDVEIQCLIKEILAKTIK